MDKGPAEEIFRVKRDFHRDLINLNSKRHGDNYKAYQLIHIKASFF